MRRGGRLRPSPGRGDLASRRTPTGAAIWYPIGDSVDLDIPGYDTRLAQACDQRLHRFLILDRAMLPRHPTGTPHHHLALVA